MRHYETLILFSPDLNAEERQNILEEVSKIIRSDFGEDPLIDDWGMRQLAYPVRKYTRGHYVRVEYGSNGEIIPELERKLRIYEGVLKFLTVKLSEEYKAA
ncbi:MAG: 30S ribosomal protein S6 [Desulfohalobiaceae bacterium]|nr:30S ribosomal protein S6 [Desulfohalobiaceae bacterium]